MTKMLLKLGCAIVAAGLLFASYTSAFADNLQFSSATYSVNENEGSATITVTRTGGTGAVGVDYVTSGGSATPYSDYGYAYGTLSWADGDTSNKTFSVPIFDDSAYEGNETVDLYLFNPTGLAGLGFPSTAELTIADNDPAPAGTLQFSSAAYSVNENGGSATITVTRTGGSNGLVAVAYVTSSGSAAPYSDYTNVNGTLIWANGDTSNKTFSVPILDDSAYEGNETVNLYLIDPPTGGTTLGSPSMAILTIVDNEPAPVGILKFSWHTYSVNENGGSALIMVTRTGGSNGAVGVNYATSNGTATAGSDYTATSGTLSWANGDTSNKTFSVPILDDSAYEGNETVNLTLTNPTGGASLGSPSTAVLTIVDNDPAPAGTLQFSSATYSVNENGGSATITVTRTGGSNGAVGVSYATTNGTATAGSDYTATSGTLNWANGDTTNKTFSITILDDSVYEGDETVNLTLYSPTGGATLGSQNTAVLTILENEPPSGSISGRVTLDLDGTGIQNVRVDVYTSTWSFVKSASTDGSGDYTVGGLLIGSYYVRTLNNLGYVDEWYNNAMSQSAATPVDVTQGSTTPGINFGLTQGGSISGRVTKDSDGTGIQNVTVQVFANTWSGVKSVLTDASGNYTAGGLLTGSYYVRTLNNLGYVDEWYNNATSQSAATPVNVTQGATTPGINFGLTQGGSISGRVTKDSDGTGIQNVTVQVFANTWSVLTSVSTDASGNYTVGGLLAGSYTVKTLNSLGYVDEWYNNATSQSAATPVDVTQGSTTPGINFGLTQGGWISGSVTKDSDGTGIQNVTVQVYTNTGSFVKSVSTSASGNYTVGGLLGSYSVRTVNNLGYVDEWYNNATSQSAATPVDVTQGSTTPGINFGLTQGGWISGRVTKDSDGTGIQNVTVQVYTNTWSFVKSVSTGASGNYTVGGLLTGSYTVKTWNSLGYVDEWYNNAMSQSAATPVDVTQGSTTPGVNFGLTQGGWISGRVTKDSDGTGIQNVTVQVYTNTGSFVTSVSTDASGNYTAGAFLSGSYYVRTVNNLGYADEWYNNAMSQSAATPVDVTQGSTTPGINFGLTQGGWISGRVTKDSDGTGIQNVAVQVYTNTWSLVKAVLTDASGNYTVGALLAGSYYVKTRNNLGYADEWYNNATSQSAATPVNVIQGSTTPNINFRLSQAIYVGQDGLCGGKIPCFRTIQNAVASVSAPSIIKITQETYNEDILLNANQVIVLEGGWDANFTSCSSSTIINGSTTITQGTMVLGSAGSLILE